MKYISLNEKFFHHWSDRLSYLRLVWPSPYGSMELVDYNHTVRSSNLTSGK